MSKRRIAMVVASVAFVAVAVAAAGSGGVIPASAGNTPPDPADFTDPVANPYFPLEPGTLAVLRGTSDGEPVVDRIHVTDRTKVIQGITTTVVRDIVSTHGRVGEKTHDWYAADNDGNVWYFGEDTATYDAHGNVLSTEGSWQAGVDGAVAGIIMRADPRPTEAYRQELYVHHAEDQAWVVERGGRLTLPYGQVRRVLRTFEWTRLEPRVVSAKLYGPGLGIVREHDVAGGDEDLSLVAFRSP